MSSNKVPLNEIERIVKEKNMKIEQEKKEIDDRYFNRKMWEIKEIFNDPECKKHMV